MFLLAVMVQLAAAVPTRVLAQDTDFAELADFEYTDRAQFSENEDRILMAADYILSIPISLSNQVRLNAMQGLVKWMSGTPDYQFLIDESITRLSKNNDVLFGIYMAAMTHYVLNHKDKPTNEAVIKLGTYEILLDYCEDPHNAIPPDRELKKAFKARRDGKLERYLGL